jgi:NhaP-type Na+/H+ or K+/H+ antiporter
VVLAYWGGIGVVLGVLAYFFLRARGEQGYNVVGEMMLGALGSLSLAMSVGVLLGWGQIFTRSGTYEELIASGVTAAIGAAAVLGVVIYLTLRASPIQHQDRRPN